MSSKIPCSVLILTRNSAATLPQCLKNLAPFGEILVHDANSEDNTAKIAQEYGVRVLPQDPTTQEKSIRVQDFTAIRLKQRADAAFDWVLYLDSDEELSDALVMELAELIPTLPIKTVENSALSRDCRNSAQARALLPGNYAASPSPAKRLHVTAWENRA